MRSLRPSFSNPDSSHRRATRPRALPIRHAATRPTARLTGLSLLVLFAGACSASGSAPSVQTASAAIGPSGGTLSQGGATLTVPAGALTATETLTISRTGDAAPAGVTALSAIYDFGPSGLTFATPVTVTIDFTGSASGAVLYWSKPAGTGYDTVAGSVSGGALTAPVAHFSHGFVGKSLPPPGDAGPDGPRIPFDAALCPSGESFCSGKCVDLQSSDTNCGGCGVVCPSSAPFCGRGTCASFCPGAEVACLTSCVDLATDPANCGVCGNVCPAGQLCSTGVCM